jgi:predicted RecB family nuclease
MEMSEAVAITVFSASDIANFLSCHHVSALDRAEEAGQIQRPFFRDTGVELLRALGIRHELAYLKDLTDNQKLEVVHIPTDIPWGDAVAKTVEAIRRGVDTVYQATFLDGPWVGRSDFLTRNDTKPSSLGNFSYEVVETKLARSTKARAILQLCFYSDLLSKIQGVQPEWMHVVLGGGAKAEKFLVSHYIAYFRKVRHDFLEASKISGSTYPEPVDFCDVCSWFPLCDKQRRDDDHLSFVAGITLIQRKELASHQIDTMERLASLALPSIPKIDRVGDAALLRVREQARLQVQGRKEQRLIYELLQPIEEGKGLAALPTASPGDIFLDFEAIPYVFDTGLEYLIGTVAVPERADTEAAYTCRWSFEPKAEKEAFEQFIQFVIERWKLYPDLHIYHYASYEQTAIKRLAGRHGTCVDAVDQLLRAGIFVDLYRIVRQALRASVESYSIKKVEGLYAFARKVSPRDSVVALQTFETLLTLSGDQEFTKEIRETIEAYNRDDCLSALRLRDWLEDRRRELEAGRNLSRPTANSGEPGEDLAERLNRTKATMAQLQLGLPVDQAAWTEQQYGRWLLAQMLEWHRREEKSSWWEYFRLCELSDAELLDDKSALAGLTYLGTVGQEKRSLIHRYGFPPQDHTIDRAHAVHDPKTQKSAGEIVAIDEGNLTVDIQRGVSSKVPHPEALIPQDIVNSEVLRESLLRLGLWVAENALDGEGPFRAERDLLLRRPPSLLAATIESVIDHNGQLSGAAKNLVLGLPEEASVLPIQGPPGSGKTFTGARMVVELVKMGYRVGIAAVSHKVISNLLREVCTVGREAGVSLQAVQKVDGTDGCDDSMVEQVEQNQAVLDAITNGETLVAAGTSWLWARAEMRGSVDVLFIDEAAQISLANVLAVAQAATSVVLLGDPQQLNQPQKGIHPPGTDGSAFDHLLQDRGTITPQQGIFLAETYRLHPDVCAFTSELFYEGRLEPRPENQKQRLNAPGTLDGTGLRFVPVPHFGNQSASSEEVERIAALVDDLLSPRSSWMDKNGETHALTLEDILIVAPYNAQVSALRQKLPSGARIGTVDKFQGQEAPVVLYSMTTSSAEDAPRGMDFLYSLNRLNVAVSRARCIAVIVASPALFQVECKTPRQIMLANAFCRFMEMAQVIS